MGRRHRARQIALKVLFELEGSPASEVEERIEYQLQEDGLTRYPDVKVFARELVLGVLANQHALDQEIRQASKHWELEQMAKMDRVILRIAAYEILVAGNVPLKAAINESIELAKEFSGAESSKFVNGILGKIATQRPATSEKR